MELDYAVKPTLKQRLKPILQYWRLGLFVGVFALLFGSFGFTFFSDIVSNGIHKHGSYTEVDLKSMGDFHFDDQAGVVSDVPKAFRNLDGKRVELKGMMWNGMAAGSKVRMFQLVYNIQKCCFNGPPRVQERVFVFVPEGKSISMHDALVAVVGKLHVQLKKNAEGTVMSVYTLDLEDLQPA